MALLATTVRRTLPFLGLAVAISGIALQSWALLATGLLLTVVMHLALNRPATPRPSIEQLRQESIKPSSEAEADVFAVVWETSRLPVRFIDWAPAPAYDPMTGRPIGDRDTSGNVVRVSTGYQMDPLAGFGETLDLRRESDGRWVVVKTVAWKS